MTRPLEEIQDEILEQLHAGAPVDREGLLLAHPQHEAALKRFFAVVDVIERSPYPRGDTLPGGRLGDFEIVREIGRGGMGVVYEARQISLNRSVALKVLPPGLRSDKRLLRRFRREAEAAARLRHPGIVPVYSIGESAGAPFFAMELVEGRSLADVLRARAADEPSGLPDDADAWRAWVVATVARVADALGYAHGQGILHRDVKPANILLESDGTPRLTDFGLALDMAATGITLTGEVFGSPLYMSPEQAMHAETPVDARTDVYSLAVTLYELLTSKLPYIGNSHAAVMTALSSGTIVPPRDVDPSMPEKLETVLLRALQHEPGERYGSAEAFAHDLRAALDAHAPLATTRPGTHGDEARLAGGVGSEAAAAGPGAGADARAGSAEAGARSGRPSLKTRFSGLLGSLGGGKLEVRVAHGASADEVAEVIGDALGGRSGLALKLGSAAAAAAAAESRDDAGDGDDSAASTTSTHRRRRGGSHRLLVGAVVVLLVALWALWAWSEERVAKIQNLNDFYASIAEGEHQQELAALREQARQDLLAGLGRPGDPGDGPPATRDGRPVMIAGEYADLANDHLADETVQRLVAGELPYGDQLVRALVEPRVLSSREAGQAPGVSLLLDVAVTHPVQAAAELVLLAHGQALREGGATTDLGRLVVPLDQHGSSVHHTLAIEVQGARGPRPATDLAQLRLQLDLAVVARPAGFDLDAPDAYERLSARPGGTRATWSSEPLAIVLGDDVQRELLADPGASDEPYDMAALVDGTLPGGHHELLSWVRPELRVRRMVSRAEPGRVELDLRIQPPTHGQRGVALLARAEAWAGDAEPVPLGQPLVLPLPALAKLPGASTTEPAAFTHVLPAGIDAVLGDALAQHSAVLRARVVLKLVGCPPDVNVNEPDAYALLNGRPGGTLATWTSDPTTLFIEDSYPADFPRALTDPASEAEMRRVVTPTGARYGGLVSLGPDSRGLKLSFAHELSRGPWPAAMEILVSPVRPVDPDAPFAERAAAVEPDLDAPVWMAGFTVDAANADERALPMSRTLVLARAPGSPDDAKALFQLESGGITRLRVQLRPSRALAAQVPDMDTYWQPNEPIEVIVPLEVRAR